jgi:Fe-S-cluster containining protein
VTDHVCVNCNLCCDGTLYPRLGVTDEERDRLAEKGEFFYKSNGELRMRLGCNYLGNDGACQCYSVRPEICRTYRCDLLKSVDAGYTSMVEANEIAQEGRALRDKARKAIVDALVSADIQPKNPNDGVVHLIDQLNLAQRLAAPISMSAFDVAKYRYESLSAFIRQFMLVPDKISDS